MSKAQYDSWSRFIAFSLQVIGVVGVIFIPVFWVFTSRVELAFLPFFGTLAGVGTGMGVLREISQNREDGTEHEG